MSPFEIQRKMSLDWAPIGVYSEVIVQSVAIANSQSFCVSPNASRTMSFFALIKLLYVEDGWHAHDLYFWQQGVVLLDGATASWPCELMGRRTPDGSWQYRRMTENDRALEQEDLAW
jgi:hypothetical protein